LTTSQDVNSGAVGKHKTPSGESLLYKVKISHRELWNTGREQDQGIIKTVMQSLSKKHYDKILLNLSR
jgi:hypothetical protein